MKTCKDCIHFRPYRDPDTKRIHPSKKGECGWQHGIEHWPLAVTMAAGQLFILRCRVFGSMRANKCQCFEWKPGAEPKAEEQLEIGGVE